MSKTNVLGLLAVALALGGEPARAQEVVAIPAAKIDETHATSLFGFDLALSGGTAVVGAPTDDGMGQSAGAAFVFVRGADAWTLEAELFSSDPQPVAQFGSSVAIDGDTLAVGTPYSDDPTVGSGTGAVEVFVRSAGTWTLQALLQADDRRTGDNFGTCLALQGDRLVVGAPRTDQLGFDSGSFYVFERSGTIWNQSAHLFASDGEEEAELGWSIALSGDTMLVGAPKATAAYAFVETGGSWTEQQILTALVPGSAQFGESVDLQGDLALVGAKGIDAAFVFGRSGSLWSELQRIEPAHPGSDYFGVDVALDGDRLLVSAMLDDDAGSNAGAVYAFARHGGAWAQQQKVVPSDLGAQDLFGYAVAFAGDVALVAATGPPGAAYEFEILETIGDRTCPAVPNSSGSAGRMSVAGSPVVADDELVLVATDLPRAPNLGYFLMGTGSNTFTPPGSAGPLCIAPGLQRYLPPPANTSELRGGFFRIVGTQGRVSGLITAGSTWSFQAWHRDGTSPSNLTDAVTVVFQ